MNTEYLAHARSWLRRTPCARFKCLQNVHRSLNWPCDCCYNYVSTYILRLPVHHMPSRCHFSYISSQLGHSVLGVLSDWYWTPFQSSREMFTYIYNAWFGYNYSKNVHCSMIIATWVFWVFSNPKNFRAPDWIEFMNMLCLLMHATPVSWVTIYGLRWQCKGSRGRSYKVLVLQEHSAIYIYT